MEMCTRELDGLMTDSRLALIFAGGWRLIRLVTVVLAFVGSKSCAEAEGPLAKSQAASVTRSVWGKLAILIRKKVAIKIEEPSGGGNHNIDRPRAVLKDGQRAVG